MIEQNKSSKNIEKIDQQRLDFNPSKNLLEAEKSKADQTVDNLIKNDNKFEINNVENHKMFADAAPSKMERWESGIKGEGLCLPDTTTEQGKIVKEKLNEMGLKGIEYENNHPDFSSVSKAEVSQTITPDRSNNYHQADEKLAAKWNEENHDGRNDWDGRKVEQYRKEHNYSWHEKYDCNTMQLIDRDIHEHFRHAGGVAVAKLNENRNNSGVKFDDD